MKNFRYLILAVLFGIGVAASACTEKPATATVTTGVVFDQPKTGADTALDATKQGADKAVDAVKGSLDETQKTSDQTADATKNVAQRTADKTTEIAGSTADKTKDIAVGVAKETAAVAATTGEIITDGWITTTVSAKFVDETLLKASNINVDTDDHVVTLKGHVASAAAKDRAAAIARGTQGVTRVVNQLVVK